LIKEGKLNFNPSTGGLVSGLKSINVEYSNTWIGWVGLPLNKVTIEDKDRINEELMVKNCFPVYLTSKEVENYYFGFCNNIIWPLFHYFPVYADYQREYWNTYKSVNQKFCDAVLKIAKPEDYIWVHDYHLMLLPQLIRERLPEASIGAFLHIPFPSSEIFRLLPWRRKILGGLMGADLIGFHVYDYVRHFLNSVRRICGHENVLGQISTEDRVIQVDAFPMGIDYEHFATKGKDPNVQNEMQRILDKIGNSKIILSIDRLDYSKGLVQRLTAYADFLENNREYHKRVTLILIVNPSRLGVANYTNLKKQVDEIVGSINGKFG